MKEDSKPLNLRFILGFVTAITGIAIISFNGSFILKINPLGDLLALCGAILWALYSVLVSKLTGNFTLRLPQPEGFSFTVSFLFSF